MSPWTQPVLSSNGVIGGESFAVSASSELDSGRMAYHAFDGVMTNNNAVGCWHSGQGFPSWLQFYNPLPLKVEKLTITNRTSDGSYLNNYSLAYSDDGETFTEFASGVSPTQADGTSFTVNVNAGWHKYWRINCRSASGNNSGYTAIGEVTVQANEVTEGTADDHNYVDVEMVPFFVCKKNERKYRWREWKQPVLTSNYSYGLVSASSVSLAEADILPPGSFHPYRALDGVTEGGEKAGSWWETASGINTGWWRWDLPVKLKIKAIKFYARGYDATAISGRFYTDDSKTLSIGDAISTAENKPWAEYDIANIPSEGIETNCLYFDVTGGCSGGWVGIGELKITAEELVEVSFGDFDVTETKYEEYAMAFRK